jgi:hypothetical protein
MSRKSAEEVLGSETFYKFRISKKEFDLFPEHSKVLIAVSSYAVTELNILERLYIFSCDELDDDELINSMSNTQRVVLLRLWSAKLFEFLDFLDEFCNQPSHAGIEEIIETTKETLRERKKSDAFSIVRNLRHEAANHYSIKAAKKNISHIPNDADLSLYLHELIGNGYFPTGEEVMFAGRLNRHKLGKEISLSRSGEVYEEWMDWNLATSRWIKTFHNDLLAKTIISAFPSRELEEDTHWFRSNKAVRLDQFTLPVIARKSK